MNLKEIIKNKKTRLCFSADFTKSCDLIEWIHKLGSHICILKTHIDILEDFDKSLIDILNKLKKQYNFLILEDRKFSDIGKTFYNQLFRGIYRINEWADIITIHGISSDGMLKYLDTSILNSEMKMSKITRIPKILIVAEMSSLNNIIDTSYTNTCYKIAVKYSHLVLGFICQHKFVDDENYLFLTPGIKLNSLNKNHSVNDQNYNTPSLAFNNGIDVIIVGSGIYNCEDPLMIIEKYK